jgi:hypothetical protein
MTLYKHKSEITLASMDDAKSCHERVPPNFRSLFVRQCHDQHAECKLILLVDNNHFSSYIFHLQNSPSICTVSSDPTLSEQCYDVAIPIPPPMNINAAAAAAAAFANASAIMTSPGGTPVAVIGLKLINATILNVIAGNCGGSGAAQKVANANTQKGLGCFSQFNPLIATQKAKNADNKKGLGHFSQLNPLVELRLWPACSTCRA